MYKLSVLVSCSHIEFANWFVAGLCRGCEIKCCWLKKHRRIEQNSYLNCACMIYVPLIRSFALTPHDSIWVCTHSQHTEWEWCSCYCFYKHSFACTLAIIYFGISLFGNSGVHTQHTYNCWMKKKHVWTFAKWNESVIIHVPTWLLIRANGIFNESSTKKRNKIASKHDECNQRI